jgi:phenylalanyl-tRNA synthetase alpha subunit
VIKKYKIILLGVPFITFSLLEAKVIEHHHHIGSSNIKLNYETLNFNNSKKKEDGKRYGIEIDHESQTYHIQYYNEQTYTNTTPLVPKDLEIKKNTIKYKYYTLDKITPSFHTLHLLQHPKIHYSHDFADSFYPL